MELPVKTIEKSYAHDIGLLETHLKKSTEQSSEPAELEKLQGQLDDLAAKYQNDDSLGSERYKLYEIQALLHYFRGDDERALSFIDTAVEVRGEAYGRANSLRSRIIAETDQDNEESLPYSGISGWLAYFMVGLIISILYSLYTVFTYGSVFDDLSSVKETIPEFVSDITPALWFEICANILVIGLGILLFSVLVMRRHEAIGLAIIFLILSVVLVVIDYIWITSIVADYNFESVSSLNNPNDMVRTILVASIWVPYFLVSKRVNATLTK